MNVLLNRPIFYEQDVKRLGTIDKPDKKTSMIPKKKEISGDQNDSIQNFNYQSPACGTEYGH